MDEYPGAATNLLATTTAVNRKFLAQVARGEVSEAQLTEPRAIAAVAITWQGRLSYGGPTQAECLALLGSAWLRARLPLWVAAIGACPNTGAICSLANRIAREIDEERTERERACEEERRRREAEGDDEPGEGQGEPGEQEVGVNGEAGEDPVSGADEPRDGDRDGAEDEAREEEAAPAAAPEAHENGDGASEDRRASGCAADDADPPAEGASGEEPAGGGDVLDALGHGATGDGEVKAEPPTFATVIDPLDLPDPGAVLREALDAGGLLAGYRAYSTEHDRWHHRSQGTPEAGLLQTCGAVDYDRHLASMTGAVNAMRRALERLLLAREHRDWEHAREAGRIDARRFGAAVAGRTNVFKRRSDRSELDTAVTFLVDLSGSMHGGRAQAARDCVIALCEALSRTTIAFEVLGFSNRELIPGVDEAAREGGTSAIGAFSRIETLDMWVFKAFNERLLEAKGAIASLDDCVGGDNTDGEAVWQAYLRLWERPEKRKVLFVLSDGAPCAMTFADDYRAFETHLREVLARVEGEGRVECVALGIQSGAVADFYKRWVCVESVSQLATEGVGLLAEVLLGLGRRAA
jgi:cobaltochelatase CobT